MLLSCLTVLCYLQLPVVLGCAVPLVIPVACAGVLLNASVFHMTVEHFGIQLTDSARASYSYLWLSVALGIMLPCWLFWESNFAAWWLLPTGMPMSVVLGAVLARASCGVASQGRKNKFITSSLWEPLLSTMERQTDPDYGQC